MIHICGSYYLFILDNAAPDVRSLDPWMTARQQKCSTTVLCYPQSRTLLQGGTAGLNPCSFGSLPYVLCVHTCSSSAKGKRDVVTPRVKGMGKSILDRMWLWPSYIQTLETSGKTGRENDKSWGYRDFSTQVVISTKVQNSSVLFAHPNLHHSN